MPMDSGFGSLWSETGYDSDTQGERANNTMAARLGILGAVKHEGLVCHSETNDNDGQSHTPARPQGKHHRARELAGELAQMHSGDTPLAFTPEDLRPGLNESRPTCACKELCRGSPPGRQDG